MNKKPILLVPMAGLGKRFRDKGFSVPKPFIVVDDKQIIDYSFNSIDATEYEKIIFVVRNEHVNSLNIDEILRKKFGNNIEIVVVSSLTQGSACSCLAAKHLINNDSPLVIYTLDVSFKPVFKFSSVPDNVDGFLLGFRANSPNYSYAEVDEKFIVKRVAEKDVISPYALVGIYVFNRGSTFIHYSEKMINLEAKTNNEYYIAPIFNFLVKDGRSIQLDLIEKMHVIGTPEELEFFRKNVSIKFGKNPIAICSDHSGYELKELFKEILNKENLHYIDFGTYSLKDCDYPDYVLQVAKHINDGFCDFGFGFCRTGQGINIYANKNSNIRAALIFDEYTAEYSIRHNCANFFSIPSKYVNANKLIAIFRQIRKNTFDGGRHTTRIKDI